MFFARFNHGQIGKYRLRLARLGVRRDIPVARRNVNRRIGEFADGALTGGAAANKRGESLGE